MRVCLNLAITQMVRRNETVNLKTDSSTCPTDYIEESSLAANFTHLAKLKSVSIFFLFCVDKINLTLSDQSYYLIF